MKIFSNIKSWSAWIACALFYFYDPILNTAPSVMVDPLMRDLQITGIGIGFIAAAYNYSYNIFQVPAGILGDALGERLLVAGSCLLLASGVLGFSFAHHYYAALLFRFIMGMGATSSTIGIVLVSSRRFPLRYFAILIGLAQLFSTIGDIYTDIVFSVLTNHLGWRMAMQITAVIGFVITLMAWISLREQRQLQVQRQPTPWKHYLTIAIKNYRTWQVCLYSLFLWTPISAFGGLWGIPYLSQRYHISVTQGGMLMSMLWIGVGVGSILIGYFSEMTQKRVIPLALSACIGLIAFSILLLVPSISYKYMMLIMLAAGLAGSGQTLSFALITDYHQSDVHGTVSGLNNLAVMLSASIVDPVIGWILEYFWDGKIVNQVHYYSTHTYNLAFCIVPACYIVCIIICCSLQETRCQPRTAAALRLKEAA